MDFGWFCIVLAPVCCWPFPDVLCFAWLRTEVIIYVVERSPNGTSRRVPATTLYAHFEQANIKSSLQQLGVSLSMARTELSPAQVKQLLQNPPAGAWAGPFGLPGKKAGVSLLGSTCEKNKRKKKKKLHVRTIVSCTSLLVFRWVFS